MVRRLCVGLFIAILLVATVLGQAATAPPPDVNTAIFQKIDQDGKNTRQFFSTELDRQRQAFYDQFDVRAAFYEKEYFDSLNTAVLKMSIIWGAVVFFIVGISNLLRITLEGKRMARMKEMIKNELKEEMYRTVPTKPTMHQQVPIFEHKPTGASAYMVTPTNTPKPKKEGWFARRKRVKESKKSEAKNWEAELQKLKTELVQQRGDEFGAPQAPPPQPQPRVEVYH